ncbi:hypothetical protein DK37_14590 [Halomonas sp. SUBG004]|nr:hypothetical protein DK37_14590 [Halomonas sp. SUBG004]
MTANAPLQQHNESHYRLPVAKGSKTLMRKFFLEESALNVVGLSYRFYSSWSYSLAARLRAMGAAAPLAAATRG